MPNISDANVLLANSGLITEIGSPRTDGKKPEPPLLLGGHCGMGLKDRLRTRQRRGKEARMMIQPNEGSMYARVF